MRVAAVPLTLDANALLSGAQFIDAFGVTTDGTVLTARQAAERVFADPPRWVTALLALRDAIVKPFGLATTRSARYAAADTVGFFPVISETPERLIMGFNDSHLDFRVVLDITAVATGQRITATTVVLTHNLPGRIYLAAIKPFHRLIARATLTAVTR